MILLLLDAFILIIAILNLFEHLDECLCLHLYGLSIGEVITLLLIDLIASIDVNLALLAFWRDVIRISF